MEDLSLHVLDIAENSIAAGARNIEIRVLRNQAQDVLVIEIVDDGRGMSGKVREKVTDPFFTTRDTRRVGLGLSLLRQAASTAGGDFSIESCNGSGTRVTACFQNSHIDRQPLGDMADTMLTLIMGNPDINFVFTCEAEGVSSSLSSHRLIEDLGDLDLCSTEGISAVRDSLRRIGQRCGN